MIYSQKKCSLCSINGLVCFWGDMPQKKWKRPVLGVLSAVMLFGGGYAVHQVIINEGAQNIYFNALVGFLGCLALLGLVTSIFGCDRCVAKIFGSAR